MQMYGHVNMCVYTYILRSILISYLLLFVTNCHKMKSVKQHKIYLVVLEVRSPRWVLAGPHSLNPSSWLFWLLEAARVPWLMAAFHPQSQQMASSSTELLSLCVRRISFSSSPARFSLLKTSWFYRARPDNTNSSHISRSLITSAT